MNKIIESFNSLGEEFPEVDKIFSDNTEIGGSIETLLFKEGGEISFYLTEEDKDHYVAKVLIYYGVIKLIHLYDKLDKSINNIRLDRSTEIISLTNNNEFIINEFEFIKGKGNRDTWLPFYKILQDLKSDLQLLNYIEIR